MSTNDGWIKMSERKPEQVDCPVWFATTNPGDCILKHWATVAHGDFETFTHWQPAVLPAPPAKELTQREKDVEAFALWEGKLMTSHYKDYDVWHAALAYRDGQNRQDLEKMHSRLLGLCVPGYASLRRRCGLDT